MRDVPRFAPLLLAGGLLGGCSNGGTSPESASLDDDETWSELPAPSQIGQGSDGRIPFLAYDDAHHVLYASMFSGGVARFVIAVTRAGRTMHRQCQVGRCISDANSERASTMPI
jgi:hypothetical protein